MTKRIRYNRGSTEETLAAAKAIVQDEPLYVYPTAGGLVITKSPPFFGQQHYIVEPGGEVEYMPSTWDRRRAS
jgi:hypothetical protein